MTSAGCLPGELIIGPTNETDPTSYGPKACVVVGILNTPPQRYGGQSFSDYLTSKGCVTVGVDI